MNGRRLFVVLAVAIALTLAACGSSSKTGTGGAATTTTAGGVTTTTAFKPTDLSLGRGVTATTIKIGVALVDFNCIKQFVNSIRQDQQAIYQAYIDDINAKGGIAGRKIVPVFHTFCPIGTTGTVTLCTQFAQDDKVFAVIGNFTDSSNDGASQECLAKTQNTVLITYLTETQMALSPPGMILCPCTAPERSDKALLNLVKTAGTLNGKTIAVLASSSSQKAVKTIITPGLKSLGVKTGTTAFLNVASSDTTAAQAQLASFLERWKSEGVNALWISGENVATQQFVEKVKKAMPGVTLLTDVSDSLSFGQQETTAGLKPNPYEGLLVAGGYRPIDYEKSANWTYCKTIYQQQTGKTAPGPFSVVPGPEGKTIDTYGSINDACQILSLFHDVAAKVGQPLNTTNWVGTVNTYGEIANRGGGPYASLRTGKYDFDDTFQLQAFDSTIAPKGNWKPLSEYQDVKS
jgi:ABC-type branched-subunit amino acid transport system substrate-binding protein